MSITVLFGTDSGTAEGIAWHIAEMARRSGVSNIAVLPGDAMPVEMWSQHSPIVFVCATACQGDFPGTMRSSWDVLRFNDAPSMCGLRFAAYGLGDSTYARYNYAVKLLHKRLVQLGGEAIIERGLGDECDQLGYAETLRPWLASLWESFKWTCTDTVTRYFKWNSTLSELPPVSCVRDTKTTFHRIIRSERLTAPTHFQQVQHIELSRGDFEYAPGDAVAIYPPADETALQRTLKVLKLKGDEVVVITQNENFVQCQTSQSFFGLPHTVKSLLATFFDVEAVASQRFLEMLSHHLDEEAHERLQELSSAEFLDEYNSYCHREKRSIFEVMEDFPYAKPPLHEVLSHMAALRPRRYSLASSPTHDASLHLTVARVSFTTPFGVVRGGVCSKFLAAAPADTTVELRPSPQRWDVSRGPWLLVGPGTGIAPLRSLVREGRGKERCLMFGGFRSKAADFLYEEEWREWKEVGEGFEMDVAFSRDQPQNKVYVQHRIRARKDDVQALVKAGAYIIICGNSKQMPREVELAIADCLDCEDAAQILRKMKKEGRLIFDTW